jgi:hypothetical protein
MQQVGGVIVATPVCFYCGRGGTLYASNASTTSAASDFSTVTFADKDKADKDAAHTPSGSGKDKADTPSGSDDASADKEKGRQDQGEG